MIQSKFNILFQLWTIVFLSWKETKVWLNKSSLCCALNFSNYLLFTDVLLQVLAISSEEQQPRVLKVGPMFSPLSQLEEVHITMANVPAIGENSFWGLKHLKLLNLTHNNVTSIRQSHLGGMRTLQVPNCCTSMFFFKTLDKSS